LPQATPIHRGMKTRTWAVYQDGVLRPLNKLNLRQGEEVEIEIANAVRRTKGIIKIDPGLGKWEDGKQCYNKIRTAQFSLMNSP
jgi:predicted DNA-binding antitoxin AbrB/MazE fold protein